MAGYQGFVQLSGNGPQAPGQARPPGPPMNPPPPPRDFLPMELRNNRPWQEISDVSQHFVSDNDMREALTEYYTIRFDKIPGKYSIDGQLVKPSWEKALKTEVRGQSSTDTARQIRQLDQTTGDVMNKKASLSPVLQQHIDTALNDLLTSDHDPANFQWILAQIDHQLKRLDRVAKNRHCNPSARRSSHHKKRQWERVAITAYFKRTPRPTVNIQTLYNATQRMAKVILQPNMMQGHPQTFQQRAQQHGQQHGGAEKGPPPPLPFGARGQGGPPGGNWPLPKDGGPKKGLPPPPPLGGRGQGGPPGGHKPLPRGAGPQGYGGPLGGGRPAGIALGPGKKPAPKVISDDESISDGSDRSSSTASSYSLPGTYTTSRSSNSSGSKRGRKRNQSRHRSRSRSHVRKGRTRETSRHFGIDGPRQHSRNEGNFIVDSGRRSPISLLSPRQMSRAPGSPIRFVHTTSASDIERIREAAFLAGRVHEKANQIVDDERERRQRPTPSPPPPRIVQMPSGVRRVAIDTSHIHRPRYGGLSDDGLHFDALSLDESEYERELRRHDKARRRDFDISPRYF
ncbi:uncharacterized protein BCR38DRAFT_410463 [Pseudomassariella vexata]|uniref:Uncharacterized protein n=1 Tax=Pseudomassariella vexata TaxID=1141098 RepID=A0A1Y2DWB2_9PEZI|nr:uncharacterized protein BCR38DRAFT_410463 [Pseudomassariella vexata]ORY63558.1 hypothetical protein BCR38DRAFT_410463 [Pseudomassariella vexata]